MSYIKFSIFKLSFLYSNYLCYFFPNVGVTILLRNFIYEVVVNCLTLIFLFVNP